MSSPSSANISPFSCLTCRNSHRKCDRALPCCGECTKKSKQCVWEAPSKRGRKGKEERLASANLIWSESTSNTNSEQEQIPSLHNSHILTQLIQIYPVFQRLMNVMPSVPPSTMDALYLVIKQEHDEPPNTMSLDVASTGEKALVNSFLAKLFLSNGRELIGRYFYDRAKEILGNTNPLLVEVTDYYVACCAMNFVEFFFSENDTTSARTCLQRTWQYLQVVNASTTKSTDLEPIKLKFLLHRCCTFAVVMSNKIDSQMLIKLLLKVNFLDFQYFYPDRPFDDSYTAFIDALDRDILNGSHSENLSLDMLSQCIEFFKKNERDFLTGALEFAAHGYRIEKLRGTGRILDAEIMDSANFVAKSPHLNEDAVITQPIWYAPIVTATQIHLQFYELASNQQQKSQVIPQLINEYNALQKTKKHHKALGNMFNDLLSRLSCIVGPLENKNKTNQLSPYSFERTLDNFKSTIMRKDSPTPSPSTSIPSNEFSNNSPTIPQYTQQPIISPSPIIQSNTITLVSQPTRIQMVNPMHQQPMQQYVYTHQMAPQYVAVNNVALGVPVHYTTNVIQQPQQVQQQQIPSGAQQYLYVHPNQQQYIQQQYQQLLGSPVQKQPQQAQQQQVYYNTNNHQQLQQQLQMQMHMQQQPMRGHSDEHFEDDFETFIDDLFGGAQ